MEDSRSLVEREHAEKARSDEGMVERTVRF